MASRECALATGRKQALALRDLVVVVANAKGVSLSTNQPGDLYTYQDARIRMEYSIVGSTFMISEGKAPWVTDEHHGDAKQPQKRAKKHFPLKRSRIIKIALGAY